MITRNELIKAEAIIGMITAPISMVSSITMIILISKSRNKFTTVLNRLLLGLCISDILSSTAQTLVSFPMPSDTSTTSTENAWIALGNITTCDIQGFVILFASIVTPSYNAGICIVSLLKVKYNNRVDERKVEPFLHIIPISISLTVSLYSVLKEYMNPQFGSCFLIDKPQDCTKRPGGNGGGDDDDDADDAATTTPCERGDGISQDGMVFFAFALVFVFIPFLIIGSNIILYKTVKKQEDRMNMYGIGSLSSLSADAQRRTSRYTKKIMHRAIAYSAAWLIPFIIPFIAYIQVLVFHERPSPMLRILKMMFFPLQGFCNLMVFIYPKMMDIRLLHPEYSTFRLFIATLSAQYYNQGGRRRRNDDVLVIALPPRARERGVSGVAVQSLSAPVFQQQPNKNPPILPDAPIVDEKIIDKI